MLVQVITCLGGRFRLYCLHAFLKILKTRNYPNQTCGYWLITPNQQTLCIETDILEQRAITNQ